MPILSTVHTHLVAEREVDRARVERRGKHDQRKVRDDRERAHNVEEREEGTDAVHAVRLRAAVHGAETLRMGMRGCDTKHT